jgi:CrcB protein
LKALFLVFVFGGLGCSLRYLMVKVFSFSQATFPLTTLLVNGIGSLLLSYIIFSGPKFNLSSDMRVALTTGAMGGFTTYSTFSHQTFVLFQDGSYFMGVMNVLLNLFCCLLGCYLGFKLA